MAARPHITSAQWCLPDQCWVTDPLKKKMHQWTEMTKVLQLAVHVFLGLTKEKKNEKTQNEIFFSSRYKKKNCLLLIIIICLFLYFSLRSKKAEANAVCLRGFSVTRLSWLHDDVSPFIQKCSERFNVFKQPRQRSSCSQLSTKGFKM